MPSMIVGPQPLAVEEGAKVLAAGGNAFDAALTCAAVQFLVDPHSCGIGGYLLLTCRPAKSGNVTTLDAPALAGSRVRAEMWHDVVIGPNPRGWGFFLKGKVNEDGHQSVCTPGMARGMQAIHQKWGSKPWKEIFAPAIRIAAEGWVVTQSLANRWKEPPQYYEGSSLRQKLDVTPDAQRIYLKDGRTRETGETLRNPDYARTLERIATHGADDFYTGGLSHEILADLDSHGGWVTADDLKNYAVREEPPVRVNYRGYDVASNQPPHGGPTLGAILNILKGWDLAALGHNSPEYLYRVSMAMKAAFADRNALLADPKFQKVPLEMMVSDERADEWRAVIESGKPIVPPTPHADGPDTTQVTVVDRWGNCVSLTHSLGSSSGAIPPGLGFMYNNSMVNFYPKPGHPNSIAPGKGRTTGMTPAIVSRGGKPVLVLGAPGATRIITSVLQTILNVVDFGMSVSDAVLAPRFDCQGDTIWCQARIPEYVCAEVRRKHPVTRLAYSHGGMALVHAIHIDEESGRLTGAADAGADGMPLLVP